MQDRKPLAAPVEIPQSLEAQADEQLKALDGDPMDDVHKAEMVKVWGSVDSYLRSLQCWFPE